MQRRVEPPMAAGRGKEGLVGLSTQQQQHPTRQPHAGRQAQAQGQGQQARAAATEPVRLVPLGGLGEIGKNMMAIEYAGEIIVVDAGLMFPDDEMLGVDLVIPDASYLLDKLDRVKGVFITHGHEDHIGGLPYVLPQLNYPPVYASPLTHGLITVKLREHRQHELARLHSVEPEGTVDVGPFQVRFLRVNHSIPDAMALAVTTPAGVIVHTGDYKFDYTPVDERRSELGAFARLGDEGVLVLCGDSTRVESPGYTPSERVIQETFSRIFAEAKGRIIIATFASLISRAQMVIDEAVRYHRKVALLGRSMINNAQMAIEMGYLHVPAGTLVPIEDIDHIPARELVILCTGSQGEPTSALTRIANGDNRWVSIQPGDTVILSSTPIVGNERAVSRNIDNLMRQGAEVLYQGRAQVHVSGHGSREELKLMLALLRPKYVVPVHGEFRMLAQHKELAISMGVAPENVVVAQDGDIIEASAEGGIAIVGHVPNGNVFVDGLGVGDVGQVVLRDRQVLSTDGILVVVLTIDAETGEPMGPPDIISRGFVYERESEPLMDAAKQRVEAVFHQAAKHHRATDWGFLKNKIRDTLGQFFYERLKRRPMILPVVVEV